MGKKYELPQTFLISKIEVSARTTKDLSSLRKRLAAYPNLRLARYGTSLCYFLDSDRKDHFYSVEIGKAFASITIHSVSTPLYFLQEALLRFINIIQMLGDSYETSMSGMYPYLVIALANAQIARTAPDRQETRKDDFTDILLAKRLIYLSKENATLLSSRNLLTSKYDGLLQRIISIEGPGCASVDALAASLGLDKAEIIRALDGMSEIGYTVMHIDSDRFSLVKA